MNKRNSNSVTTCVCLGTFQGAFASPLVWLTVLLTTCTAVLPSLAVRALLLVLNPPDTHRVSGGAGQRVARRPAASRCVS